MEQRGDAHDNLDSISKGGVEKPSPNLTNSDRNLFCRIAQQLHIKTCMSHP